jgi:DEAD/DEAH box helicase domain-containing protein
MFPHLTTEYIQALLKSERLGGQVAAHRYFPAKHGNSAGVDVAVPAALHGMLQRLGIKTLYAHQARAISSVRNKRHTMVATATASGKSLIYNLALFEAVDRIPSARGLYIFPLKALTQDQLTAFDTWRAAAEDILVTAAVYDGDTSAYRRKKIRDNPPSVLMTNPEMVHLALLPYHPKWSEFFKHLRFVVIDEVHAYRGMLGSHMAQLMRRFRRICALYDSDPTFIFTSATIANPSHLAEQITGLPVNTIEKSDAPVGGRHMVLINPDDSPSQTAMLLLKSALARNLRTIVYTQSRKLAELITIWMQREVGGMASKISVYRAGLLPEERRKVEQRLKTGQLLAVVTTSALELGIDIGDLDLCILVGYPGSMISTWQRSGRVGRQGQEAAIIMIANQDALDQYYVEQPEVFFEGQPEPAVINPYNEKVLESHIVCAAAESILSTDEPWLAQLDTVSALERLEHTGELMRSADGMQIHARRRRPHLKVSLRSTGTRYRIVHGKVGIGEINDFRLYREAHPGAIYLHQGQSYLVESIDESTQCVNARPVQVDYYTRSRTDGDVNILETGKSITYDILNIYIGKVKVTDHVTGYERVNTVNGRRLDRIELDLPPVVYTTDALWCAIDGSICDAVSRQGYDLLGSLHASEHAAIGAMPMVVLADRNDIGGLATPFHPQTRSATIFIYDGIPGGAGFSRQGFSSRRKLFKFAYEAIARCNCETGCPACIHSPKCGSGNHPMDKRGAMALLSRFANLGRSHRQIKPPVKHPVKKAGRLSKPPAERFGVFDLETQHSASEVGGWHMAHRMKVSCAVVYDSGDDTYAVYQESEMAHLMAHLKQLDLIVGFNSKRFDYRVLSGYSDCNFDSLHSLDLLELIYRQLGFRLSLDHLARQTLRISKSGSGLDALRWWRQGRIEKISAYCRKDVEITRDLYLFARDNGYLIYQQKNGDRLRIPLTIS